MSFSVAPAAGHTASLPTAGRSSIAIHLLAGSTSLPGTWESGDLRPEASCGLFARTCSGGIGERRPRRTPT